MGYPTEESEFEPTYVFFGDEDEDEYEDRCGDPNCEACYPYEHVSSPDSDPVVERLAYKAGEAVADAYDQGYADGVDDGFETGYSEGLSAGARDALDLSQLAGASPAGLAEHLSDKLDVFCPSVIDAIEGLYTNQRTLRALIAAQAETVADIVQGHEQSLQEITDVLEGLDQRLDDLEDLEDSGF